MIDGNISMEEDTELRDLVVQTLENNGVLAKVRAELRASVFLALEEQESVMNPEPLLNKTVKQYLANSEGKLLFSLVREFLEYFGLDYTISVYDPETYCGKEYNYVGRNKLQEELGITTNEPLLGEILKNSINGAFSNLQKNESIDNRHNKTDETSSNFANATFDVSVAKVIQNESVSNKSNDNNSYDKLDSTSESNPTVPINVTIMDKKRKEMPANDNKTTDKLDCNTEQNSLREMNNDSNDSTKLDEINGKGNNNVIFEQTPTCPNDTNNAVANQIIQETDVIAMPNQTNLCNRIDSLIKFDESVCTEVQTTNQNCVNNLEIHIPNNVQNKKPVTNANCFGKTVYFEQIIVGGKKESPSTMNKTESFVEDPPPVDHKTISIYGDLPPLNGKTTNISDLKELMNIGLAADGIEHYDDDFVSSASGSINGQSPTANPDKTETPTKLQINKKEEKTQSTHSGDVSEEIEEIDEMLSSTSCLEDMNIDKNISNFTTGFTTDCIEKV